MTDTLVTVVDPDPDGAGRAEHGCPECERQFKTKAGLISHRSAAHGVAGKGAHEKRSRAPRQPRVKEPSVKENALAFYLLGADFWSIRDPVCGEALRAAAPAAAESWAQLAKRYAWVERFWSDISGAGGWAGLLVAHMPLVMAVFAHHVQPAIEARRAAAAPDDEELSGNGYGAFAEAPAG